MSSLKYYDRQGRVISMEEWGRHLEDFAYKVVNQTTLPGGVWVSTVWLGMDHGFGMTHRPLIFETMVFESATNLSDHDCERYATEEEANLGHDAMVCKWTGWTPGEDPPSDDAMVVMYPKDGSPGDE